MEIYDFQFWLSVIVPIAGVIIAFVGVSIAYREYRRRKKGENVPEQMLKSMKSMNEELKLLRKQAREGQLSNAEIRKQEMLQRQRHQQLRETIDVIKGMAELAKLAKQFEEFEDEED